MWIEEDTDYCFLHSDTANKSVRRVKEELEDVQGTITGIRLHDIDDATNLDFTDASIPRADFSGSNLRGVSFDGANLAGADFSGTNLKSTTFCESEDSGNQPDLRNTLFDGAECNQTEFQLANLEGALFRRTSIIDTELWGIKGTQINFTEASIRDTRLHQSNLDCSIFTGGTVQDTHFNAAELSETDFTDCRIVNCDFTDANLSGSRFSGAVLDNETTFGTRLLSEYEADKAAESSYIHKCLSIPSVSDRGFGREIEGISGTPPRSPFESIPKRKAIPNHLIGIPFRMWNRTASHLNCSDDEGSDESLPRQLKALDEATEVYGNLKSAYRDGPFAKKARKFNVRERESERKRHFPSFTSARNSLLKWGMWYGESPGHVVKIGLLTWGIAAIAFLLSGIQTPTETIVFSWQGTLRLNLIADVAIFSFRRLFTFSNGSYSISGGGELLGTSVSAIGKLLEAMLIFTLGRRAVS
ncbi:pentapeptide repeat-containing protein [Halorubrum halophilum]|uniref:pentapeptide repeat-containing protein n=1 Tax=Halorubrum halophilum TaxID=413816 RepID=UPI00186B17AA|nr:pentapeptide repeat-containing protein [Halorubrum halophilum]